MTAGGPDSKATETAGGPVDGPTAGPVDGPTAGAAGPSDGPTAGAAVPVGDLAAELVGLAGELRTAGVAVDTGRLAAAVEALTALRPIGRNAVYWATRLTLCSRGTDLPVFDAVFTRRFGAARRSASPSGTPCLAAAPDGPAATTVVAAGTPEAGSVGTPETGAAGRPVTGAGTESGTGAEFETESEFVDDDPATRATGPAVPGTPGSATSPGAGATGTDPPTRRDLRTLSRAERAEIDVLIALLGPADRTRRSTRHRPGGRRRIDAYQTARLMVRNGGEPVRPRFRRRAGKPRRLVLLIDVSESMDGYSDAFLRFAHAAVSAAPATTEVFTLGTRCTRITPALRNRDPEPATAAAVATLDSGWGGGTLLGATLRHFLRRYGGRDVVRAATVVIASDGHDAGPAATLTGQVDRLSRLAHRLVWVNPQQGWPGYRPMAPGLVASLRFVDHHLPGHSFQALSDLAEMINR